MRYVRRPCTSRKRGAREKKKKEKGRIIVEENFHKTGEERAGVMLVTRFYRDRDRRDERERLDLEGGTKRVLLILFFICWFTDELLSAISEF